VSPEDKPMATLESIEATLLALIKANDEWHARIMSQLECMNSIQRGHSERITRLEEQQRMRTGLLATLSVLASALAGWLGIQR
jgi:hypothetical protein